METAPFFDDIADGPDGARAYWVEAGDGVRLRVGVWGGGSKGTVLLFPGRTEYIEKYGRAAAELLQRGYSTVAIDWRGQGLAGRLIADADAGHIGHFSDYQLDLAAVLAALPALDLAAPMFLLTHSMGGGIGLRSLMGGPLKVRAAVFSAPMWDISLPPRMRLLGKAVLALADAIGLGGWYVPGTSGAQTYVLSAGFEGNDLTTDAEMYAYMQAQITAHPELALGAPTVRWVHQALHETAELARRPSPATPVLTFLGGAENIVCTEAIYERMARWPSGRLEEIPGARHEVMMETPQTRAHVFETTCAFFDQFTG